jgi:hypothetical protein
MVGSAGIGPEPVLKTVTKAIEKIADQMKFNEQSSRGS